jgi:6-pyruvoyl-tetrahydropterin synthase
VDLEALDGHVRRTVVDQVDHAKLEDVPALAGVITTGESLARAFWRVLTDGLPTGRLSRVTVVETAKNRFEYRGEDA